MNKKKTKIIALIPAKKNSKELKNKNLKKFLFSVTLTTNLNLFLIKCLRAKSI